MRIYIRFLSVLFMLSFGCVKAPIKPNQQLCAMAQSNVKQRLGPEFRRVIAAKLLFDDQRGTYGCGIVYERVDEELAEEFEEMKEGTSGPNHLVSFISRVEGKSARFLEVRRSRTAPGPVSVELQVAEITGDNYLDLLILERAPQTGSMVDYQALKIGNGDPLLTSEIFEMPLLVKSDEGVEFLAAWEIDASKPKPTLVIRGGTESRSYQFAPVSRRLLPVSSGAPTKLAPTKPKTSSTTSVEGFNAADLDEEKDSISEPEESAKPNPSTP